MLAVRTLIFRKQFGKENVFLDTSGGGHGRGGGWGIRLLIYLRENFFEVLFERNRRLCRLSMEMTILYGLEGGGEREGEFNI